MPLAAMLHPRGKSALDEAKTFNSRAETWTWVRDTGAELLDQTWSPSLFVLPIMWYNSFPCRLSKFDLFQPSMYIAKSNLTDTVLSEHLSWLSPNEVSTKRRELHPPVTTTVCSAGSRQCKKKEKGSGWRGVAEGNGLGTTCTVLSPERQFSLMSDHPALNATNRKLQTQDSCHQQECCAQTLLLWIVFGIQRPLFLGRTFTAEIMLIHFCNWLPWWLVW